MKCITCNAWTDILETRNTRRRRVCANGHRFTTYEFAIEDARSKAQKERYLRDGMSPNNKRGPNGKFVA